MPTFDYDWGPDFNANDGSGVPTKPPPPIKQVVNMKVPRVNADGNEVGSVPTGCTMRRSAPISAEHHGRWRPAVPRWTNLQLRWRHGAIRQDEGGASRQWRFPPVAGGTLQGPRGLRRCCSRSGGECFRKGFLLQADADALIVQAEARRVLRP